MVTAIEPLLREQLLDRRYKLESATNAFQDVSELSRLLEEVDAALKRMDLGTYGLCEYKEWDSGVVLAYPGSAVLHSRRRTGRGV